MRKATTIATMLVLTTLLAAPWVLAQQQATGVDPSELDFDNRPSFFCGYITGNPEDKCITDENGVNVAPDGTTFMVDNGVVTFSDGRMLVIDRPSDTGFLQYQPEPETCVTPQEFGDYASLIVPCDQPGAIPMNSI